MRVIFSNRAYASVLAETTEKIKTETGGLFLGTVQDDTFYIIETIDPGPKSIFEVAYFEYDQKYTQHLINKIANLYDKKLSLIGLWHRHPGSFDQFSSTDNGTNTEYAAMRKEGAISALVNIDPEFRITMYQVNQPCKYTKIPYDVGDQLIPDELLRFKTPDRFYSIMDNILHPHTASEQSENGYHKSVNLASFMKFVLPQLKEFECPYMENSDGLIASKGEFIPTNPDYLQEKLLDEIVDDLSFMADTLGIETAISDSGYNSLAVYQETIGGTTKLIFIGKMLDSDITFYFNEKRYVYHRRMLTEAFKKEKSERDKQNEVSNDLKFRKQNGVIDSVIKIIKFNRNEE